MRLGVTLGLLAAAWAGAAKAAATLEVRGAGARILVIPEIRSTVEVTVTHTDPRLPLWVRRFGDRVVVSGDVAHRVRGCRVAGGRKGVTIAGRGAVPYEQLPSLIARVPMSARLTVGDGVFGELGRATSVDFTDVGCGDWILADVAGRLKLNQAGDGAARAGSAGSADVSVGGSGDIALGEVRGGLMAVSSGSGAITAASVVGPLDARVAGSGDIDIKAGSVTDMTVAIAGSGAVRLGGVARRLNASIAGSGDISVARVTGTVRRQVFGRGVVRIGP